MGISETVIRTPPIKIQGIKTKAIPYIKHNIDWNADGRWVEPFLGSAVVLLNVNPKRAIVGDSNPHIIEFYRSIQEGSLNPQSLRMYLEREGKNLFQIGEKHYYEIRDRFNTDPNSFDFLFLNRSGYNGLIRFNKKGKYNTPFCRKIDRFRPAYITKICNQVKWVAETINRKDWDFVCSDWSELMENVRDNDFVYADPPYVGRYTDYFNSWDEKDALRLEQKLKNLPCSFIYSMWSENKYRKNERLHQAFSNYTIKTFSHFYHLGSSEKLRNSMTEALVVG